MKKFALLLSATLITAAAFAQEGNKNDAAGKRHGAWSGTYEESKRKRYEGTFEHGKEKGTFKFYDDTADSNLMATRVFNADGSCYTTFFDPKGNKVSEGKEVNHKQEGEWKYYHYQSKAIMQVEYYKQGLLNGPRKVYFENGTLAEEESYVNGLKQGIYKKYTEKAVLLEESNYVKGKPEGRAVYYDNKGEIASEGIYAEGRKSGIWKFYKNGKVEKEEDMDAKYKAVQKGKTSN